MNAGLEMAHPFTKSLSLNAVRKCPVTLYSQRAGASSGGRNSVDHARKMCAKTRYSSQCLSRRIKFTYFSADISTASVDTKLISALSDVSGLLNSPRQQWRTPYFCLDNDSRVASRTECSEDVSKLPEVVVVNCCFYFAFLVLLL